jgi:hypothetical protein
MNLDGLWAAIILIVAIGILGGVLTGAAVVLVNIWHRRMTR